MVKIPASFVLSKSGRPRFWCKSFRIIAGPKWCCVKLKRGEP